MPRPSTAVGRAVWQASPSLALIKYWGKSDSRANLPATPSIAVTLSGLASETRVFALPGGAAADRVLVGGEEQPPERYAAFFDALRAAAGGEWRFWAESANNFPTAAGLASSSSGFAALALAAAAACGADLPAERLSGLARLGSGSAARSLYGGFTELPAGAESAAVLHPAEHWPELRLAIVRIDAGKKELSSRLAMERTRQSSPYYQAWVADAPLVCARAKAALAARDLPALGQAMRNSYLRMFATMFAADDPIIYWHDRSLAVIKACARLRAAGVQAWETMDAGPQVKILCTEADLPAIARELDGYDLSVDRVGSGPRPLERPRLLGGVPAAFAREAAARGVDLGEPA